MNRKFSNKFNKSMKIIGIVLIMAFSFQGCKVNIFDPLSPDGASLMDSAESLTEKGDAFFANGDLSSAETAYKAALKKDPNYGPALIGLAAVELQKAVSPDGTKTFTANVLPIIYKGLESLTPAEGSDSLSFEDFLNNPAAKSIAEKKQVAQAAEKAFNTLIQLSNPDLAEMINLSVLLGFNVIFKLADILNSLENFQTILDQFESTSSGDNQFTLDYNEIISFDPITFTPTYDITELNTQLDNFREIYQKLYYVFYLFSEGSEDVILKIDEIYVMLEGYFSVVSTSDNEYIQKIYTQAVTIRGEIENVYNEIQNSPDYIKRVGAAAGRITEIENQVQSLKNDNPSIFESVNSEISLCGQTIEEVTGVVGESQFTLGSSEENLQPVISDDANLPCTGVNVRFETAN